MIGVNEVPENETDKYGVISIDKSTSTNKTYFLKDIVEKPKTNPPSNLQLLVDMFFPIKSLNIFII